MCGISHVFLLRLLGSINYIPLLMPTSVIRFLPGLLAALAGFLLLKAMAWIPLSVQLLLFLAVYFLVTVIIDRALRKYGDR